MVFGSARVSVPGLGRGRISGISGRRGGRADRGERPVGSSSQGGQAVSSSWGRSHLDHVFVIMMENTSYNDLLSPSNRNTRYIRHLAATAGLANHYFGVTHDSLPNYIAATSGQTWGSNSDDTSQAPLFDHENLVDQFEAAHVSWKAYMESLPFPGDLVEPPRMGCMCASTTRS